MEKNFEIIKKHAITPDVVRKRLDEYEAPRIQVDEEMQASKARGKKYIEENFGPGIVGDWHFFDLV